MNQVSDAKYDYLSFRNLYAGVAGAVVLWLGSVIALEITPELPSTLMLISLLVSMVVYTFIMMKGHAKRRQTVLRMLFLSAVFSTFFWLRHELIVGDPEIRALRATTTGTAFCGDTYHKPCTVLHLKYFMLLSWL